MICILIKTKKKCKIKCNKIAYKIKVDYLSIEHLNNTGNVNIHII